MKSKDELMRVVKKRDGTVGIDYDGKQDGRGAYLCKRQECLKTAKKKRQLDRSFKMRIDEKIYEQLEKYITEAEYVRRKD